MAATYHAPPACRKWARDFVRRANTEATDAAGGSHSSPRRAGYGAQQRQGEALALLLRHAGHEVAAQTDPFRSSFGGRAAFDSFVVHGGLLFPFGPSMCPGSYGSTSIQSFPISLRRRFS